LSRNWNCALVPFSDQCLLQDRFPGCFFGGPLVDRNRRAGALLAAVISATGRSDIRS